mgnify:CR=1 FL=1
MQSPSCNTVCALGIRISSPCFKREITALSWHVCSTGLTYGQIQPDSSPGTSKCSVQGTGCAVPSPVCVLLHSSPLPSVWEATSQKESPQSPKRIGNTVGNGSQRRLGTVNGHRQTRCTGQGTGYQAHDTWRIDVKKIFHSAPCQAGRSHYQQRNQNQGFSLAPERMEETRTGLNANRKDKQHQPEDSQFLWNGYPQCPKARAMKITADTSSDRPITLIRPSIKPKATIKKIAKYEVCSKSVNMD